MARASSSHPLGKSWLVANDLFCLATSRPNGIEASFKYLPLWGLWFCAWSMRIVMLPAFWSTYVPMLSPVFGSGAHWLSSQRLAFAIRVHVLSGVVMLLCGGLQFSKTLRRTRPAVHRWTGRLYLLSGLATVASLQPLRALSGGFAQKGDGASRLMAAFIDVASLAWILSAGMAVYHAAVRRDFGRHRQWAATSLALALTPVSQRLMLLTILQPCAMTARMLQDAAIRGLPPWRSAWGEAPAIWSGAPAAPFVLSLEGYGVAENAVFPCSAWLGLFVLVWFAGTIIWSGEHQAERPDADHDQGSSGSDSGGGSGSKPTSTSTSSALFELCVLEELGAWLRRYPREQAFARRACWVVARPFLGDVELAGRPWRRLATRCANGALLTTYVAASAVSAYAVVVGNAVLTAVAGALMVATQAVVATFGAMCVLAILMPLAGVYSGITDTPVFLFSPGMAPPP